MVAVTETEDGKYKDLEILSVTTNPSDKHDYYGMKIYPLEDEDTIKIGAVHNGCSFTDNEQELLEIAKDKETDGFIKYDLKKIDRINE